MVLLLGALGGFGVAVLLVSGGFAFGGRWLVSGVAVLFVVVGWFCFWGRFGGVGWLCFGGCLLVVSKTT